MGNNSEIKKRILTLAASGKRLDKRALDEERKVELSYDLSMHAEGSCQISLGQTQVMVGVKVGLGKPYDDTPNAGNLIVNAEVTALAGPEYEPGPLSDDVVTMARVVDRGIRESHCIDMEKMVIKEGERVWEVFIDTYVTNDDGNLIDACAIGAIAALKKAKLPVYDKKADKIDLEGKKTKALPLVDEPIPVTIAKIGEYLFADPTKDEEKSSDAVITLTINNEGHIVASQKGGFEGFNAEEIAKALKIAIKISKDIRSRIK